MTLVLRGMLTGHLAMVDSILRLDVTRYQCDALSVYGCFQAEVGSHTVSTCVENPTEMSSHFQKEPLWPSLRCPLKERHMEISASVIYWPATTIQCLSISNTWRDNCVLNIRIVPGSISGHQGVRFGLISMFSKRTIRVATIGFCDRVLIKSIATYFTLEQRRYCAEKVNLKILFQNPLQERRLTVFCESLRSRVVIGPHKIPSCSEAY
ncbi:hypothetical protein FB45DRAFT_860060 [Roridomyces roridus]|uniref:Uncharacterized protein n=1 Tax=Roridomyces roridus TaxID=1738132 RepID=A0AAD7FZQ2_9AGAR|nr:hypothetical protein FB45DRAFT_860060 [Roridomyces roridus]